MTKNEFLELKKGDSVLFNSSVKKIKDIIDIEDTGRIELFFEDNTFIKFYKSYLDCILDILDSHK